MIKDFLLVRAAPSMPAEKMQHYLECVHAPLAMSVPALARETERYVMSHIIETGSPDCCLYPPMNGLTTIVEHMFGGWEGIQRFSVDEQYLAVVRPDEQHMVEQMMDGAPQFIAIDDERTVFASALPGSMRMFDFVRRPAHLPREEFLKRLEDDAAWAAADPPYRAATNQRVDSVVGTGTASFGGDAEPFDAVIETWIADAVQFAELAVEQRDRRADFCDSDRSFSAMTTERRILG